jgi:hypothetical protein
MIKNTPNLLAEYKKSDYQNGELEKALSMDLNEIIAELKNIISSPEEYKLSDGKNIQLFLPSLLAFTRQEEAHTLLIEIFSLPEIEEIFPKDFRQYKLSGIFFATMGKNTELLKNLFLNNDVNCYCRLAAAKALVFALIKGKADRKEILDLITGIFTPEYTLRESNHYFLGNIADLLIELVIPEANDALYLAFQRGIISGEEYNVDYYYNLKANNINDYDYFTGQMLHIMPDENFVNYMTDFAVNMDLLD